MNRNNKKRDKNDKQFSCSKLLFANLFNRQYFDSLKLMRKAFVILGLLILINPLDGLSQIRQKSDIIYRDPKGRFIWIKKSQQVAAPDVELRAFFVHFEQRNRVRIEDTTLINFFVPDSYSMKIIIQDENHLSEIMPAKEKWNSHQFQCFDIPNSILNELSLDPQHLQAFGKTQHHSQADLMIPILQNVKLPNSLNYYEFRLLPNMDIEVIYTIHQEIESDRWEIILKKDQYRHYPGRASFPIKWDGRINGRITPEGFYKLVIEGSKFIESSELDLVKTYYFYHKPIFEPCLIK